MVDAYGTLYTLYPGNIELTLNVSLLDAIAAEKLDCREGAAA